jgi:hypothetical protein
MNYYVVFDALRNGSQLAICLFLPLFLLVPGAVRWALKSSPGPHSVWKEKTFLFISIVTFGVSLLVATISFVEYHQMALFLGEGDYQVTEGIVKNFVPSSGTPVESFTVGEASFHYGSGWNSIAFNSAWNRGYSQRRAGQNHSPRNKYSSCCGKVNGLCSWERVAPLVERSARAGITTTTRHRSRLVTVSPGTSST